MGKSEYTRRLPFSKNAVFEELLDVLKFLGFKIESSDPMSGLVKATKGVNIWSWGQAVTILVTQLSTATQVQVESHEKYQLYGWEQDRKNVIDILTVLETRMQTRKLDQKMQ